MMNPSAPLGCHHTKTSEHFLSTEEDSNSSPQASHKELLRTTLSSENDVESSEYCHDKMKRSSSEMAETISNSNDNRLVSSIPFHFSEEADYFHCETKNSQKTSLTNSLSLSPPQSMEMSDAKSQKDVKESVERMNKRNGFHLKHPINAADGGVDDGDDGNCVKNKKYLKCVTEMKEEDEKNDFSSLSGCPSSQVMQLVFDTNEEDVVVHLSNRNEQFETEGEGSSFDVERQGVPQKHSRLRDQLNRSSTAGFMVLDCYLEDEEDVEGDEHISEDGVRKDLTLSKSKPMFFDGKRTKIVHSSFATKKDGEFLATKFEKQRGDDVDSEIADYNSFLSANPASSKGGSLADVKTKRRVRGEPNTFHASFDNESTTVAESVPMEEILFNKTMELFPHLQAIMKGFQTSSFSGDGANSGASTSVSTSGENSVISDQNSSQILFPDLATVMAKETKSFTGFSGLDAADTTATTTAVTDFINNAAQGMAYSATTTAEKSTELEISPPTDDHHKEFLKRLSTSSLFGTGSRDGMDIEPQNSSSDLTMTVKPVKPVKEKRHKCDQCGKAFGRSSDLRRHIRIHTGERNHICPICHKAFNQSGDLQRHVKTHTGEKPHICLVCGKGFTQKGDVKIHMRIHTGERPHECPVCGKTFNQSSYLTTHIKSHTGERNHICGVCHKAFVENSDLKKHMRIHTGEKPHACYVCHKAFNRNNNLVRHIVNIHGMERNDVNNCLASGANDAEVVK